MIYGGGHKLGVHTQTPPKLRLCKYTIFFYFHNNNSGYEMAIEFRFLTVATTYVFLIS